MSNPYDQFLADLDYGSIVAPLNTQVSSIFGDARDGGARKHKGYDLPAPAGTPLVAPTDMEFIQGGVGGTNLRPNDRWAHFRVPGTHYEWRVAHQGEIPETGTKIAQGQPFGTVGGAIEGTHLHMGLYNTATGEYEDWGQSVGLKKGGKLEAGKSFAESLGKRAGAVAAEVNPYDQFLPDTAKTGASPYDQFAQEEPQKIPQPLGPMGDPIQPEQMRPVATGGEQAQKADDPLAEIREKIINLPNIGYRPEIVRPLLNALGLAGGEIAGLAAAPVTGPVGPIAGPALGYGISEKAADAADYLAGAKKAPSVGESMVQSGKDLITGATIAATGLTTGKGLQAGLSAAGKVGKMALGKLGGAGTGAVEEALKGGENFTKAMRGKLSGEEVVGMAQDALQNIRNARGADYQAKLADIGQIQGEIDISPIQAKLRDLMKQFRVKITPEGELDFTSVAIGNKGRKDIKEMVDTVWGWEDKTPLGIDALKRYLSDFYSESSQARAFTASLTRKVNDTLSRQIPEYAEMTKPYAEATKIIKDIESGLMMRKQGMTGRITADQTLRRLTSSMRDNFELRRDLVRVLGEQGGEDVSGAVAGHAMSPVLPRGLMGIASVTEAGLTLARVISPKFLPIIIASSPRVQGEFLRMFGKGLKESTGMSIPVAETMAYLALRKKEGKDAKEQPEEPEPKGQRYSILEKQ